MEYGGEKSLNDLIEKRREDGLKAFSAADIEKVALHVARGLQVRPRRCHASAGKTKGAVTQALCAPPPRSIFTTRSSCCTET